MRGAYRYIASWPHKRTQCQLLQAHSDRYLVVICLRQVPVSCTLTCLPNVLHTVSVHVGAVL